MSKNKILTKKIADQLIDGDESVDMSEYTTLDEDAAEVLCEYYGDLGLSGLTEISENVAEILSQHQGFLKGHEGRLDLSSLSNISDPTAASLSNHYGPVDLSGLNSFSDSASRSFSEHEGWLSLKGLSSINEYAVECLSNHRGGLYLSGLKSICDQSSKFFSRHAYFLDLSGLNSLTADSMQNLAQHSGILKLPEEFEEKVSQLSPHFEVLTEGIVDEFLYIMERSGFDYEEGYDQSTFDNLPGELRKYRAITDDAAERISTYEWGVNLDGLKEISDSAAESFGRKEIWKFDDDDVFGQISLMGLLSLSDNAARSLANLEKNELLLPSNLIDKVEKHRNETGSSDTDAVEELLDDNLNSLDMLEALKEKIEKKIEEKKK